MAADRTVVAQYLFLEGMLSPMTNGPVLPDMLQSTQQPGQPPDPHTTNLVTSLFTTAFNAGGFVGAAPPANQRCIMHACQTQGVAV